MSIQQSPSQEVEQTLPSWLAFGLSCAPLWLRIRGVHHITHRRWLKARVFACSPQGRSYARKGIQALLTNNADLFLFHQIGGKTLLHTTVALNRIHSWCSPSWFSTLIAFYLFNLVFKTLKLNEGVTEPSKIKWLYWLNSQVLAAASAL